MAGSGGLEAQSSDLDGPFGHQRSSSPPPSPLATVRRCVGLGTPFAPWFKSCLLLQDVDLGRSVFFQN